MKQERFIQKLMEKTGRSESDCILINYILESHNIFGHRNKDKIKKDFMERLSITEPEADELYNACAETIVKGVFRK